MLYTLRISQNLQAGAFCAVSGLTSLGLFVPHMFAQAAKDVVSCDPSDPAWGMETREIKFMHLKS